MQVNFIFQILWFLNFCKSKFNNTNTWALLHIRPKLNCNKNVRNGSAYKRHGKNVDPVITQLTVGTYFSQRQRIFDSVRHTCSIISFTTFFLPATKEHYGQWGMYNSKECIWEICVPCRTCLNLSTLYMFQICALRNIYSYVRNKCTLIKYAFITYLYSPTCFGHFCDHHQGALREYW